MHDAVSVELVVQQSLNKPRIVPQIPAFTYFLHLVL